MRRPGPLGIQRGPKARRFAGFPWEVGHFPWEVGGNRPLEARRRGRDPTRPVCSALRLLQLASRVHHPVRHPFVSFGRDTRTLRDRRAVAS